MDFTPDEDHEAIADAVRKVCAGFDDDYWARCDAEHEFPWDFYRRMAEGGWVGIAIPEEYGGGGRGITEAAIMLREVAASGAAMNGCSALHLTIFGLNPVVRFGSDRLKDAFLPRAAAGDLHVAFGVTEPDAGTDTTRITTRAEPDGKGGWVVTGRKIWTSKALECEVVLLLARTGGARPAAASRCSSPTSTATTSTSAPIPKMGRNAVASCEVAYDGLPVEDWRLVGEEGQGFKHLLHGLNPERILLASEAFGIGEVALRRAVAYARSASSSTARSAPTRRSPTRSPRPTSSWRRRGRWPARGLALRPRTRRAARRPTAAKYLAAEAGFFAADRAVQTYGGMGYATEYHVERYLREARLQRIAPVSQEMTLNYIAQQVLRLPRSY